LAGPAAGGRGIFQMVPSANPSTCAVSIGRRFSTAAVVVVVLAVAIGCGSEASSPTSQPVLRFIEAPPQEIFEIGDIAEEIEVFDLSPDRRAKNGGWSVEAGTAGRIADTVQGCIHNAPVYFYSTMKAAKNGTAIDGGTMYVTASPCWNCFKAIANAGIVRIVFGEFYRDERVFETSKALGIELVDLSGSSAT